MRIFVAVFLASSFCSDDSVAGFDFGLASPHAAVDWL